jgi:phage shock protein PspC (stress-responsive transcriptional regulator)
MATKLVRSRRDVIVGGVCGGLAESLGIDSTLVRIFFVLLSLGNGIGVLLYLVLWFALPREDGAQTGDWYDSFGQRMRGMQHDVIDATHSAPDRKTGMILGIGLIIAGGIFLLHNLHLPWLGWLNYGVFWPALLILAGLLLIFSRMRGD